MLMDKLSITIATFAILLISSLAFAELPQPKEIGRDFLKRLSLAEHVQLNWPLQEVSFPLEFEQGQCLQASVMLVDPVGNPQAFQLSDMSHYPDGQFLRSARIHFLTALPSGNNKTFGVYFSNRADAVTESPATPLALEQNNTALVISNGKIALRLANGTAQYQPAKLSAEVPAPLLAVRGVDGKWRGKGYLDTWWRVLDYKTTVLADGPIYAEVQTTYRFEQGKTYTMTVRLVDQMDWAHIEEQMDLGPRCKFVFDCSEGFAPDRLGLATSSNNVESRQLHYFDDVLQARMSVFTQYTQLFDFRDALGVYQQTGAEDFLGIFVSNPGKWSRVKVSPIEFWERRELGNDYMTRDRLTPFAKTDALPNPNTQNLHGHSVYNGHFTWEFPLYDGRREWCITMTDKAEQFRRGTARLRQQVTQVTACPLDRAKDFVLSWPAPPLPQAADQPQQQEDTQDRRRHFSIDRLAGYVNSFYYANGWSALNAVAIRGIAPLCDYYLQQRKAGAITPEQDALARARFALLAYILQSPDNYPYNRSMLPFDDPESTEPLYGGMINQNFGTDIYNTVGNIGLTFPKHPASQAWIEHFRKQLDEQLSFYLYPQSGCWEESHTYANHVMTTILPTLHKLLKQNVNLFADERLKKMFNFFIVIATPFDKNHNSRVTPNVGDHDEGTNYRNIYRYAAEGFATVDKTFAQNLMWLYREQGGTETGPVEPAAPELNSQWLQGFGAVLRAKDARGDETYLLLRCGEAWGHYHADDNSIQLYANGAPLISDAGKGSRQSGDWKYEARGHSRIDLPEVTLHNYVGRYHRGWVTDRYFSDTADYVVGYTPFLDNLGPRKDGNPAQLMPINPGYHDRQILFVRPDYFLIRDTVRTGHYSEDLWMHLDAEKIDRDGNIITAESEFGVELDMIFLQGLDRWFETDTVFGRPKSTRYVKITQRPDTDFIYLLYPRRKGEPRPAVQPIRQGREIIGVQVKRGDTTETLFLTHQPIDYSTDKIDFHGTAGLIRTTADTVTLSLPKGQSIRYGEQTLNGGAKNE